ncbi:MAG: hypothetical protein LBT86_10515 [Deltaproteobacteria bacterium]|nr:hypothetical protein [Deltaproteobacteria bacterium]
MVSVISNTKTAQGLTVSRELDHRKYATGRKATDEEISRVKISHSNFQGEWNYEIHPTSLSWIKSFSTP